MENTIKNKQLSTILQEQIVCCKENHASFSIDNEELNFSASLDQKSLAFNCALWIGDNEEQVQLTDEQQDSIYLLLLNTEPQDSLYDPNDHEHAITLIHS